MKNYQQMLSHILEHGTTQSNRTGVKAISVPGYMLQFDLSKGFPAVTTKKLAFKTMVGELIGFLRGYSSAAQFRSLGCNIWDQNANENKAWLENPNRKGDDDLGRIYGVQWRDWSEYRGEDQCLTDLNGDAPAYIRGTFDQVQNAIDTIRSDPTNRRIIISAWRPDEFALMALPPCHVLYQFIVDTTNCKLNMCLYQRSHERLH